MTKTIRTALIGHGECGKPFMRQALGVAVDIAPSDNCWSYELFGHRTI
jgi:hypothetical protein